MKSCIENLMSHPNFYPWKKNVDQVIEELIEPLEKQQDHYRRLVRNLQDINWPTEHKSGTLTFFKKRDKDEIVIYIKKIAEEKTYDKPIDFFIKNKIQAMA